MNPSTGLSQDEIEMAKAAARMKAQQLLATKSIGDGITVAAPPHNATTWPTAVPTTALTVGHNTTNRLNPTLAASPTISSHLVLPTISSGCSLPMNLSGSKLTTSSAGGSLPTFEQGVSAATAIAQAISLQQQQLSIGARHSYPLRFGSPPSGVTTAPFQYTSGFQPPCPFPPFMSPPPNRFPPSYSASNMSVCSPPTPFPTFVPPPIAFRSSTCLSPSHYSPCGTPNFAYNPFILPNTSGGTREAEVAGGMPSRSVGGIGDTSNAANTNYIFGPKSGGGGDNGTTADLENMSVNELVKIVNAEMPQLDEVPFTIKELDDGSGWVCEVNINDSPVCSRLIKKDTQQEIRRRCGVSIVVRGKYRPVNERTEQTSTSIDGSDGSATNRGLYLRIKADHKNKIIEAAKLVGKLMSPHTRQVMADVSPSQQKQWKAEIEGGQCRFVEFIIQRSRAHVELVTPGEVYQSSPSNSHFSYSASSNSTSSPSNPYASVYARSCASLMLAVRLLEDLFASTSQRWRQRETQDSGSG